MIEDDHFLFVRGDCYRGNLCTYDIADILRDIHLPYLTLCNVSSDRPIFRARRREARYVDLVRILTCTLYES